MVAAAVVRSAAPLSMEMKRSWEEKKVAGERGERRGTALVSVRREAELGLLKLRSAGDGEEMFVRSSLLLAGLVGVGAATGGQMKGGTCVVWPAGSAG